MIVVTKLQIHHGTDINFPNVFWVEKGQTVGYPLLGRHILDAIGFNKRNVLSAAQNYGVVDV